MIETCSLVTVCMIECDLESINLINGGPFQLLNDLESVAPIFYPLGLKL
jgi:hypothetical protein